MPNRCGREAGPTESPPRRCCGSIRGGWKRSRGPEARPEPRNRLCGCGFLLRALRWLLAFLFLAAFGLGRTVEELDQRHRGVVALAEAELEDAQIPAVPRLVARAQLVEELHDDLAVAQPIE